MKENFLLNDRAMPEAGRGQINLKKTMKAEQEQKRFAVGLEVIELQDDEMALLKGGIRTRSDGNNGCDCQCGCGNTGCDCQCICLDPPIILDPGCYVG